MIKKNFPEYLIKIVWDMITNKTFLMADGSHTSSKEFSIARSATRNSKFPATLQYLQ